MLRSLLKWGALLIIGILVYNRFFGNEAEKARSKAIGNQTRELFHSVRDVVRDEREKFNEGKYDRAVQKVRNVFGNLRDVAHDNKDILSEIEDLDKKRADIEARLEKIKKMPEDMPSSYDKLTEKGGNANKPMPKIGNPKEKPTTLKADEQKRLEKEMDDLLDKTNQLMDKMDKDK